MENEGKLIKTIKISEGQRKRTTLGKVMFYDVLEIYENKVVGYSKENKSMTWYFKEYIGIGIVKANMNSQFAQIVFLTGINSKNHFVGIDMSSSINHNIVNDTNRILFCSGMFSFKRTNEYTNDIGEEIKKLLIYIKVMIQFLYPQLYLVQMKLENIKIYSMKE